jgi:hypothetical protein
VQYWHLKYHFATARRETRLARIAFVDGHIEVPAELIAEGLGVSLTQMQTLMREARITGRCESGIDDDAGATSAHLLLRRPPVPADH